jgi:predicted PurR-regulated permease PerM
VNIDEQFAYLDEGLKKLLSSTGIILGFTLGIFSTGLGFLAFFILFFIFILNYRRILNNFIVNVFTEKHKSSVRIMTKRYIIGLCLQVIIVSILTTTVLTILGVKYAILLGVLTGLLNVIPYIGIFISLLISCFIAFATNTPSTCIYVAIGYVIVHAIDGNIILPFVVGSKVKINALFSFIGILVGEHLWELQGCFYVFRPLPLSKLFSKGLRGFSLGENYSVKKKNRTRKRRNIKLLKK